MSGNKRLAHNLLIGALCGFLYGLAYLLTEDSFALLLDQVNFTLRQIGFSILIYSCFFTCSGICGAWLLHLTRSRTRTQQVFVPNLLLLLTCFALFYLGYNKIPFRFFAHSLKTQIPVAFFWGLLVLFIYLLSLKLTKSRRGKNPDIAAFRRIGIAIALTAIMIINLRTDSDAFLTQSLSHFEPWWRALALLLALGFYFLFKSFCEIRSGRIRFVPPRWGSIIVSLILIITSVYGGSKLLIRPPTAHLGDKYKRTEASPANVILIVIDALRADHVGFNGYYRSTTPNLDALAQEAFVFKQALAPSSWTKESVPAFLSGRYPGMNGIHGMYDLIPKELTSIQNILKENGYLTAAFSANPLLSEQFHFDRGFDDFHYVPNRGPKQILFPRDIISRHFKIAMEYAFRMELIDDNIHSADGRVMNSEILPWLRRNAQNQFSLYLHYMDAHAPSAPNYRNFSQHQNLTFQDYRRIRDFSDPNRVDLNEARATDSRMIDCLTNRYDDDVYRADQAVGELLCLLRNLNLMKTSMIIITADHGEGLGEHGVGGHGQSLYQEVLRIPLMIYLPQPEPSAHEIGGWISTMDLAPTICDYVGIKPQVSFAGISLLPLLERSPGDLTPPERPYFSEFATLRMAIPYKHTFTFIKDNYKLIYSELIETGECVKTELYHLTEDPQELHNLVDAKPEIAKLLLTEMAAYRHHCDSLQIHSENGNADQNLDALRENLKALGYLW